MQRTAGGGPLSESTALQPVEAGVPLTARQLVSRLAVIQDVMRNVMQDGADYGVIPGTQKPTLYKPGAEKLCVTFRLAPDQPIIEAVPELTGDVRYRVQVPIRAADGSLVAVGVGECSTGEEKYRWRRPVHPAEFQAAAEDQKRQKWTREGDKWDQVRVNPADIANTVLKMAHKRAYVHGVIMATAAGSIFTQDIEDLPDGVAQDQAADDAPAPRRGTTQPPQRKAAPPAGAGTTTQITVRGVTEKKGTNDRGPWTLFGVVGDDGKTYKTFDVEIATLAREAAKSKVLIEVTYTENKFGRDLQSASHPEPASREPGGEG